RIAQVVSVLVVAVLAALSLWFAWVHNPEEAMSETRAAPPAAPIQVQEETALRGRTVYNDQGCATCHSIAGAGNPRYPLDGVGTRWELEEIRAWITGAGFVADLLSGPILR